MFCKTLQQAILSEPFQLFRRIFHIFSSITKASPILCWFQSRKQVNISCSQVSRVWRMLQCHHIVFAKNSSIKTSRCAAQSSWRRNQLLVLHFWRGLSVTAHTKGYEDVNGHLFIHRSNSLNYTWEIRTPFEATTYSNQRMNNIAICNGKLKH
jgi:hypothetical protein